MLSLILEYFLYALLVIISGVSLAYAVDQIAEATGIGKIFLGSLLLAGSTSLPELLVDLNAVQINQPNLAVGDLLGSSLFNLLILALVDAFYRKRLQIFTPNYVHHSLSVTMSIMLTSILGLGLLSEVHFSIFNIGLFTWMIAIVYIWGLLIGKNTSLRPTQETESTISPINRIRLIKFSSMFLFSTLLLLLAAPRLVSIADELAIQSNLGHSFIGTTLIALTTSLPELAATLTAFRINSADLALSNIFGSNTFNMILLLPLDFLGAGPILAEVSSKNAITAFAVILSSGIVLMSYTRRTQRRPSFWEPSSELILITITASLYLLYLTKSH